MTSLLRPASSHPLNRLPERDKLGGMSLGWLVAVGVLLPAFLLFAGALLAFLMLFQLIINIAEALSLFHGGNMNERTPKCRVRNPTENFR